MKSDAFSSAHGADQRRRLLLLLKQFISLDLVQIGLSVCYHFECAKYGAMKLNYGSCFSHVYMRWSVRVAFFQSYSRNIQFEIEVDWKLNPFVAHRTHVFRRTNPHDSNFPSKVSLKKHSHFFYQFFVCTLLASQQKNTQIQRFTIIKLQSLHIVFQSQRIADSSSTMERVSSDIHCERVAELS